MGRKEVQRETLFEKKKSKIGLEEIKKKRNGRVILSEHLRPLLDIAGLWVGGKKETKSQLCQKKEGVACDPDSLGSFRKKIPVVRPYYWGTEGKKKGPERKDGKLVCIRFKQSRASKQSTTTKKGPEEKKTHLAVRK